MSVLNVNTIQPVGSASTVTINALVNSDTSLSFGVNSDEKFRIDSDGNIGINTTDPAYALDIHSDGDAQLRLKSNGTGASDDTVLRSVISGATASNYFYFGNSTDSNVGVIKYSHNNDSMAFTTNASEKVRIESGGNVGIGTNNPNTKLHVYGGVIKSQSDPANTDTDVELFRAQSGSSGTAVFTIRAADASDNNTAWDFKTNANEDLKFTIGGSSERARITSAGLVGLGITNPTEKLHVIGQVGGTNPTAGSKWDIARFVAHDYSATNSGGLTIGAYWNNSSVSGRRSYIQSSQSTDSGSTARDLLLNPDGGEVGIGTDDPRQLLHVSGGDIFISALDAPNVRISSNMTDSSDAERAFFGVCTGTNNFANGTASGDTVLRGTDGNTLRFAEGTSIRMSIASNGDIGAPSGDNIYDASDERLKENMVELVNALSKVNKLKPISYNYKVGWNEDTEGKTKYGFGAQTTQEVDELLIEPFSNEDVELNGEKIDNPLRVNEKFIIPLLVKAIQEQQEQIEDLKSRIANLESS